MPTELLWQVFAVIGLGAVLIVGIIVGIGLFAIGLEFILTIWDSWKEEE